MRLTRHAIISWTPWTVWMFPNIVKSKSQVPLPTLLACFALVFFIAWMFLWYHPNASMSLVFQHSAGVLSLGLFGVFDPYLFAGWFWGGSWSLKHKSNQQKTSPNLAFSAANVFKRYSSWKESCCMPFKLQLYSSSSNLAKRPFCRLSSNFPEICSPFPWLLELA